MGWESGSSSSSKATLFFYSHRWSRPNWCEVMQLEAAWGSAERTAAEAEGEQFGDPDDATHAKAKALVQYARWFKHNMNKGGSGAFGWWAGISNEIDEVFYWVDYACADQTAPGPDMAALPAYVAVCATLVLASWTDAYAARAWCRVELLMSYAFVTTGDQVLVLPEGFVDEEHWAVDKREDTLLDPAEGLLTNPSDKAVIASLRGVAERSTAFSCWRPGASA